MVHFKFCQQISVCPHSKLLCSRQPPTLCWQNYTTSGKQRNRQWKVRLDTLVSSADCLCSFSSWCLSRAPFMLYQHSYSRGAMQSLQKHVDVHVLWQLGVGTCNLLPELLLAEAGKQGQGLT